MSGTTQPYAWGSTTAIPELMGRRPDGSPVAEFWLGAHPSAPSRLFDDAAGEPGADGRLDDLVAVDPVRLLGAASVAEFGPRLSYLLKLLAADQPLSLQAHPTRRQAEDGYARERRANVALDAPDRVFADNWPKPEMLVALGDVEALCGFRDPAQTYALFEQLGVADALHLIGPLADESRDPADRLQEVFGRLLRLDESEHTVIAQTVAAAAEVRETTSDPELGRFAATAVELDRSYAGDPGILAALTMNRITFGRDQAVYLPAGNLHAYLRGFGVEIMANSDNVLRGGLTSKFVAVDELLDVLDFTPGEPPLVEVEQEDPGVFRYLTPAPEFRLWRLEVDAVPLRVPGDGSGRVLLAVDGRVVAGVDDDRVVLVPGEALFVDPLERVQLGGSGTAFLAGPGL